jgi:hypothetical protein
LTLGELSIALELDTVAFKAQLAAIQNALRGLPDEVQTRIRQASTNAGQQGNVVGGKLSQGIQQGLIRNSPLIAAAVGGALAAGAPLALAGASVLFGGIGAVSAAQNEEVQAAWVGLWDLIKTEAVAAAEPITSEFTVMADKIGASFLRLTPQLRQAFEIVGPQVDALAQSVLTAGETAMPALVRAAGEAGPAMEGLGHIVEQLGTGLAGFFDAIAAHGPAAGTAFTALGDTVGSLLPILGELLGQGVELAAAVLPTVAAAMGTVADVAGTLGPLLPAIAMGFAAFKIAGVVAPMVATLAQQLAFASLIGGTAGRAAGAMSTAVAGLGRALPVAAVGMALFAAQTASATSVENEWAQTLLKGGDAAAQLRAANDDATDSVQHSIFEWLGLKESYDDAAEAAEELRARMTPLERATSIAAEKQNDYTAAVARHGQESPQARAALDAYNKALAEEGRVAGEAERALYGVTKAMIAQADQALAGIDSGFAYKNSLNQLEDAQAALTLAQEEHGVSSEEAQRALLALEEQNYRTALAFGQQQADMSGAAKDSEEYARIVHETALEELYRLRDAAGPGMAAAITQQIERLEASGVTMGSTGVQAGALRKQMEDLGLSVREIPGQRFVQIDAPTEEQRQRIAGLGQAVTEMPDGSFVVHANTEQARGEVQGFINDYNNRKIYFQGIFQQSNVPIFRNFGAAAGGPIQEYAAGGAVRGPGTGTSDSVVAYGPKGLPNYRLSNGEHIVTAAEVRAAGGHNAVMGQRQAWLRGYADGGMVMAEDGTWVPASFYTARPAGAPRTLVNGRSLDEVLEETRRNREAREAAAAAPAAPAAPAAGVGAGALVGLEITGRLEIGGDGIARITHGQVVSAVTTLNRALSARGAAR